MCGIPTIETKRLRLRPFDPDDAEDVRRLAGDAQVAATTLRIPHPYPDGEAERWIGTHEDKFKKGAALLLAITLKEMNDLLGAVGLEISRLHEHAEIGYWIGVPYWGRGYATEAATAMLHFAFEQLNVHRVFAHHMLHNHASGRVLEKIGMAHEGVLREHILKDGRFIDVALVGMTREMYDAFDNDT